MAETTADAINHLVDKVGDGLAQISTAISSHAPQAWELVVRGNYARAIANVVFGGGFLVASAILGAVAWHLVNRGLRAWRAQTTQYSEVGWPEITAGVVSAGIAVILLIVGIFNAFDPASIATMIDPQGITARSILLRTLDR